MQLRDEKFRFRREADRFNAVTFFEHADDFALDYLPPDSPELNPIEQVWKLTRRRCLHDRYFPMPEGVITAVESEFAGWAGPNESRRTLCATIQDALFISGWSYGNGWGWMSSLRKHLHGDGAAVPWSRVAAVLTINRLCGPGSELAVEQHWYPSTALDDLLPPANVRRAAVPNSHPKLRIEHAEAINEDKCQRRGNSEAESRLNSQRNW